MDSINKYLQGNMAAEPSIYVSSSIASLGGFLFGFDTGVIGGALPYIRDDPIFEPYMGSAWLSSMMQGLVVSSTLFGGGLGSLVGGILSDTKGRFGVMIMMDVLFILGGILMSMCANIGILVLGRFVVGLAIGGAAAVTPVHIAEQAPASTRGSLVSLNIVYVTFGQLVAYIVNSMLNGHWRLMLGLSLVPAVAQILGLLLLEHVRTETEISGENPKHFSYYETIRHSLPGSVRRQLRLGVMLQVLQQACGINTVMYFLPIILQQAGIKHFVQWSTIPATFNVLGTLIGRSTVDTYGRRRVLLSSMVGISLVLLGLSTVFGLAAKESPPVDPTQGPSSCPTIDGMKTCSDCLSSGCIFCAPYSNNTSKSAFTHGGSCLAHGIMSDDALTRCQESLDITSVVIFDHGCPTKTIYSVFIFSLICLYLLAFAPGLGVVPWVVGSEIFHKDFRGVSMGMLVIVSPLAISFVS